jgi:bifunctional non-homologous end joining protein LigD
MGESWQFCELLARVVTRKHPREATIERSVTTTGKRVYLDYLQNLPGRTIATAYSVRANQFAGVSTPLRWEQLCHDLPPEAFTIHTIGERIKRAGDLWAVLRDTPGIKVRARR